MQHFYPCDWKNFQHDAPIACAGYTNSKGSRTLGISGSVLMLRTTEQHEFEHVTNGKEIQIERESV